MEAEARNCHHCCLASWRRQPAPPSSLVSDSPRGSVRSQLLETAGDCGPGSPIPHVHLASSSLRPFRTRNLGTAFGYSADRHARPDTILQARHAFEQALPHVESGTDLWFTPRFNLVNTLETLGEMQQSPGIIDQAIAELTALLRP